MLSLNIFQKISMQCKDPPTPTVCVGAHLNITELDTSPAKAEHLALKVLKGELQNFDSNEEKMEHHKQELRPEVKINYWCYQKTEFTKALN